jgi:hypothetical protein
VVLVQYLRWLATKPSILAANRQRHVTQRGALITRLDTTPQQSTNPGSIASNTAALGVAWQTFGAFLEQQGH